MAINSWREYWFVKYVLAELPLIGSYCRMPTLAAATDHEIKHRLETLGGTFCMILPRLMAQKSSDMGMQSHHEMNMSLVDFFSMWLYMELGMMACSLAYNVLTRGLIYPTVRVACGFYQQNSLTEEVELTVLTLKGTL